MIYDLTFNPVEALINIVYKNGSEPKKIAKQIALLTVPFIAFAVIWSVIMPGIIGYYGQPFEEETHVLSQMPMYGNNYIETRETKFGSRYYRYMKMGDLDFSETDKNARTVFAKSDMNSNMITITYQNPKRKAPQFFFMDASTWPKQRKDVQYVFTVCFD